MHKLVKHLQQESLGFSLSQRKHEIIDMREIVSIENKVIIVCFLSSFSFSTVNNLRTNLFESQDARSTVDRSNIFHLERNGGFQFVAVVFLAFRKL